MLGPGANRAWCAPTTLVHTLKRLQDAASSTRKAVKRRRYDDAFKRHLVELSLLPGASVARIALDHRLNTNVLFKWRRSHLRSLAQSGRKTATELLPVTVEEPEGAVAEVSAPALNPASQRRARTAAAAGGVIEHDLPLGRVRLTGTVDVAALRVVIEALSQR
jgi:transposase